MCRKGGLFWFLAIVLAFSVGTSRGDDTGLTSTHEMIGASPEIDGFSIVPAPDIPGRRHEGDLALSQYYEIRRPDMKAMAVKRLLSSCSCMRIIMEKKEFAAGERAFLEVRTVKPTPEGGAMYIGFVQIGSPLDDALQFYVTLKSEQKG